MLEERCPLGTSMPVSTWMSCFAAPEGYLVGMTRISISLAPCNARSKADTASSLLSSMAITTFSGRKI